MSVENMNRSPGDSTTVKDCPYPLSKGIRTAVLWYVKDCPVPFSNLLVSGSIVSVVKQMGCFNDDCGIWTFHNETLTTSECLELDDFYLFYKTIGNADAFVMEIMNHASLTYRGRVDLVIISKSHSKDLEFIRVINALRSRCKVLLIHPFDKATSEEVFQTAESIFTYARVDGGTSLDHVCPMDSDQGDVIPMEYSDLDYFSKPILRDIDHLRTAVFWDVEDYPIFSVDPFSICPTIRQTLKSKGHRFIGEMSIFAYADGEITDDILALYKSARIYIMPRVPGGKYGRARRMLHDMWFWLIDAPVDGVASPNLILFSNKVSGDLYINDWIPRLKSRGFNLFLVQSEKPGSSDWLESLRNHLEALCLDFPHKPMRQKTSQSKKKKPRLEEPSL